MILTTHPEIVSLEMPSHKVSYMKQTDVEVKELLTGLVGFRYERRAPTG